MRQRQGSWVANPVVVEKDLRESRRRSKSTAETASVRVGDVDARRTQAGVPWCSDQISEESKDEHQRH